MTVKVSSKVLGDGDPKSFVDAALESKVLLILTLCFSWLGLIWRRICVDRWRSLFFQGGLMFPVLFNGLVSNSSLATNREKCFIIIFCLGSLSGRSTGKAISEKGGKALRINRLRLKLPPYSRHKSLFTPFFTLLPASSVICRVAVERVLAVQKQMFDRSGGVAQALQLYWDEVGQNGMNFNNVLCVRVAQLCKRIFCRRKKGSVMERRTLVGFLVE